MPRSRARTTYLFSSVIACVVIACVVVAVVTSAAAPQSNIPTKLYVSSAQRTLGVREQTELRIRLINQTGNEIAATYDTQVKVIATRQKDIDTAKRDGKGTASFQRNGTLALPGGVNTVQTIVSIKKGQSAAALQFTSHQAGSVRIFAENEKLVTGATFIAVVVKTGKTATNTRRMADAAIFQHASFQERRPAAAAPPIAPPTPAAATSATKYQLKIEDEGRADADLVGNKKQMRRFTVQLTLEGDSGGNCEAAPEDVEVSLSTVKGEGKFSPADSFIIPKDDCVYPTEANKFIELSTETGGDIEVVAKKVVRRAGISVRPSPAVTFPFKTTIRATKLLVTATKQVAMANGIESIDLIIRPVDDGNNPVRNEDEGLEVRHVTLRLDSRVFGLKFADGANSIPIKKGEAFIVTSVTSSGPVAGAKIVAGAENIDRKMIYGEQQLEFCFPWTQLGSAMLGGLMFPLMLTAFPGKRREHGLEGGKLKNISLYLLVALFLGAVAFALVFFGAIGLTEFNFNGIPVTIARLPVHNWFAAIVIGFLGATLLVKGIPFKGRAPEQEGGEPEGGQAASGESTGGESPAQA